MLNGHSRALATLVLLLAPGLLALGGCGGDDTPQTREGFILEADGVCESFVDEFTEAGSQSPGTPKEVANANRVLADLYERFSERMSEVRLPAGGRARTQAKAYVDSVRRSRPLLDRLRAASAEFLAAAESRDTRALQTAGNDLRQALDAFRASRSASDRLAVAYGLNLCGNLD
ncbi:MAG TPA: hypothetical protein VGV90_07655 [Solirubrobacteraceae bacterium]|nr:hypothetical protein [Solirubrobacteraceae bacterium]